MNLLAKWKDSLSIHSYFALLLIACSYLFYSHALERLTEERKQFSAHYQQLIKARDDASAQQRYLLKELESLQDPIWLEWKLMYALGLVPEGATKVLFVAAPPPSF